jgi:hypothetical protein
MTDRTTINVDKPTHSEASDVKEEYGETWPEVLAFYAEYRPQVDTPGSEPMQEVDTSPLSDEISRLEGKIDDLQTHLDSRFDEVTR